jgi:hypothetical protein
MGRPEDWPAAIADWVRLGERFLVQHAPGAVIDPGELEGLLKARDELLAVLSQPCPEDLDLGDLPERARLLDLELLRRVQLDIERRRTELGDLGRLSTALKGYAAPQRGEEARRRSSRFIDTRS